VDELNPGSFALVQLYHVRDADGCYRELWDRTDVQDNDYTVRTVRIDRGPVFAKDGGSRKDWDERYVPVYVANLADYGITPQQVFSGEFLGTVRRWLTPIVKRVVDSAREAGKDLKRQTGDIADEAAKFQWREAQRADATRPCLAYKHCKDDMKAWERQRERASNLENYYMPPPAPKAV
jgi:hypothetical protein